MCDCSQAARDREVPTRAGKVREIVAWVVPNAILVLMPKCPLCLAAYVTLGTGLGLSLTTAKYLRWGMIFLCVAALAFLVVKRAKRSRVFDKYFKKEIEPCNIK